MDNNQNTNNENWQSVLNEYGDQPTEQPVQQAQTQQFAQQAQQYNAQPQQAQQFNAQPQQFAQQAQQFNAQSQQFAQQAQQFNAQPQQFAQQAQQYNAQSQQFAQQAQQFNAQPQQFTQQTQQYNAQPQQFAQQAQFAQSNGQQYNPAFDAASFAVMPVKKKNKALPIVFIILAAAIVIGGLIFAYFTFFANSGSRYEQLERSYFSGLSTKFDTIVPSSGKIGQQMKLTIQPGKAVIEKAGLGELSPSVFEIKQFADIDAQKTSGSAIIKSGDTDLMSANVFMDGTRIYLQFPELSQYYLTADISKIGDIMDDIPDMDSFDDSMLMSDSMLLDAGGFGSSALEQFDALKDIDPEIFNKIADIMINAYFETFKDVATSSADFTVGDITVKCELNTIQFTDETVMKYVLNLLNAVEKDNDIMAILEGFGISKSAIASIKPMIEEFIAKATKEVMGEMKVYVKDNAIVGRVISIANEAEIKIAHIEDNGKFAFEFSASASGEEAFKISGNGTTDGKKYDGSIDFTADSENIMSGTYSLTFDEYVNGTFSLNVNDTSTGETVGLNFTIESSASGMKVAYDLISNGESMLTLSLESTEIPYEEIAIPEINSSNSIDISTGSPNGPYEQFQNDVEKNMETILSKISSIEKPDMISAMFQMMLSSVAAQY